MNHLSSLLRIIWSSGSILAMILVTASACQNRNAAYYNRGRPETLLDVSSEVVNVSIATKSETDNLADIIAKDIPTRVELLCDALDKNCKATQAMLEGHEVPTTFISSPSNKATLTYERILAHDCDARYLNNGFVFYGEPAPSFGCAMAANTVQHVSDKSEFINPNLSDHPSAVGAVNAMRRAYAPPPTQNEKYGVGDSVVQSN